MLRLVYVYKGLSRASGDHFTWDPNRETKCSLLEDEGFLITDGYLDFLEGLLKRKIIDRAMIVIESKSDTGCKVYGNIECYVIPNLNVLHQYLRPDDVLLMRGGRKWWRPFVDSMNSLGHWLIFYSAAGKMIRWPHWDIILLDTSNEPKIVGDNQLYIPFNKPINSTLFQPRQIDRVYDICIGASRIHDIKKQWRFIDAAVAYKKIYGEDLKCVMAGNFGTPRYSKETIRTLEIIKSGKVSVDMPGYISRDKLATIFNQSKIFGHQCSGQNDRAALEATVCGVPLLVLSSADNCYAPWITRNPEVCYITQSKGSAEILAKEIREWIQKSTEDRRKLVANYASTHNDIEFTYNQFAKLFECFKKIGKPDRAKMIKEFIT